MRPPDRCRREWSAAESLDDPPTPTPSTRPRRFRASTLTDAQADLRAADQRAGRHLPLHTARRAQRSAQVTTDNVGKPFAIVLDDQVISAPRHPGADHRRLGPDLRQLHARERQRPRRAAARRRTARDVLGRGGAHGRRRARRRLRSRPASGRPDIGAVAVIVFMVICLRARSACSPTSRWSSTSCMIFAVLSLLQATLTLPGIAGIVLTIGMAVDANVLIFERIREERRHRQVRRVGDRCRLLRTPSAPSSTPTSPR